MYESHPVVNSLILHHLGHGDITPRRDIARIEGKTVDFRDGESAEYDLILTATGYQLDYPFIAREHLNWEPKVQLRDGLVKTIAYFDGLLSAGEA